MWEYTLSMGWIIAAASRLADNDSNCYKKTGSLRRGNHFLGLFVAYHPAGLTDAFVKPRLVHLAILIIHFGVAFVLQNVLRVGVQLLASCRKISGVVSFVVQQHQ